jgi:putative endopeptidase
VALRTLLEDAAKQTGKGRMYQLVGDYYTSGMDSLAVEKKGYQPIREDLDRLANVKDLNGALDEMVRHRRQGTSMLFAFYVGQDDKNPNKYMPHLFQSGTTLPDRDYYLQNNPRFEKVRQAYGEHLNKMFTLIGETPEQAAADAQTVLKLETALAKAQLPRVDLRDPYKTYNKFTVAEFSKTTPKLNWASLLTKMGAKGQDTLIVATPAFFRSADSLLAATPIEQVRTYLRWQLLHEAAPYLSHAFVQENFKLQQDPYRPEGTHPPLAAREYAHRRATGRTTGPALRGYVLQARRQAAHGETGGQPPDLLRIAHQRPRLDEPRHQEKGPGETQSLQAQNRLPRKMENLRGRYHPQG